MIDKLQYGLPFAITLTKYQLENHISKENKSKALKNRVEYRVQ